VTSGGLQSLILQRILLIQGKSVRHLKRMGTDVLHCFATDCETGKG